MNFSGLLEHHREIDYCNPVWSLLHDTEKLASLNATFKQHGFNDFSLHGNGDHSLYLNDAANPAIVIKVMKEPKFRDVIPHILQPIHVMEMEGYTIEILPKLSILKAEGGGYLEE